YVGGQFNLIGSRAKGRIARYYTDGRLDADFASGIGFDGTVVTLLLTDNRLYAGGAFSSYDGQTTEKIARLHLDGSLDTAFVVPGTGFNSSVVKIKPSFDTPGAIYAAGNFTDYNGTGAVRMARLLSNGSLDVGFNSGSGFDATVLDFVQVSVAPFNIAAVGTFLNHGGNQAQRIGMVTVAGAFDGGFSAFPACDSVARAITIVNGTELYVFGDFANYNATAAEGGVVLTTNGAFQVGIPAGFTSGAGPVAVVKAPWLSDHFYVGGSFSTFSTQSPAHAMLINNGGAINVSFDTDPGFDGNVRALAASAATEYRIYMGGLFTSYNSVSADYLARLRTDGTLDTSFPQVP
ncbi:MAG: delta-60 repeat domain-containing protein, partial [Bdellovibrionales bacterium]|nr:delta-60 repeat domain-containing protein [Bdellovibrionales bacterium]